MILLSTETLMSREEYIQFVCVQDNEGVTHYF